MSKRYQLLIFDWDGTLMDSVAYIEQCVGEVAKHLGVSTSDQHIRNNIGLGFMDAMRASFPALSHEELQLAYQRFLEIYYADMDRAVCLFAGAEELLDGLQQQGYTLAIATGKSRAGLNRALSYLGIVHLFATTRCADETATKPNPLMITEILSELAVSSQEALMIGDTHYDMQLAKNAGMDALAVAYGAGCPEELSSFEPVGIVHSVRELGLWLSFTPS